MADVPTVPDIGAYDFYREEWDSYEELRESFEHEVPETFNIATYACDRWAPDKGRVALFGGGEDAADRTYTFRELANVTDRLAKYEYPREVEFVDELPMTVTGKVRRTDLREREGL